MDGSVLGLVEMLLVLGIVLALGLRELWALRRDRRRDRRAPGVEPPRR
jgi:hypothetical protein